MRSSPGYTHQLVERGKRLLAFRIAALTIALLLAGCGSDSGSTDAAEAIAASDSETIGENEGRSTTSASDTPASAGAGESTTTESPTMTTENAVVDLTADEFASAIAPGPRPDQVVSELGESEASSSIRHADVVDFIPAGSFSSAASVEYFNPGAEEPVAVATLYRTATPEAANEIHAAVIEGLRPAVQAQSFEETIFEDGTYAVARSVINRDMWMHASPSLGGWVILSEMGQGFDGTTEWVYDTGRRIQELTSTTTPEAAGLLFNDFVTQWSTAMASFPAELPPDVGVDLWAAAPEPQERDDGVFGRVFFLVGNPGFVVQTTEDVESGILENIQLIALQPLADVSEEAFFGIVATFQRQILWASMPEPNEELLAEQEQQLATAVNADAVTINNVAYEVHASPGEVRIQADFGTGS